MLENSLRLQLAQFNNFIIDKYLHYKQNIFTHEPQSYLYDAFYTLSSGLASAGKILNNPTSPDNYDLSAIKDALHESFISASLIEKSAGMDELANEVKLIVNVKLATIIDKIKLYGAEFNKTAEDIEQEIEEVKSDYSGYFNADASFKHTGEPISFEEAATFLTEKSEISQVKQKFSFGKDCFNFFADLIAQGVKEVNTEKLIKYTIHSLSLIFITLSYIEPFFEVKEKDTDTFQAFVKHIATLQKQFSNTLSA